MRVSFRFFWNGFPVVYLYQKPLKAVSRPSIIMRREISTANLIIIDVRYQLSTVFSTSLLLENRWNHDNGRQLFWEWQYGKLYNKIAKKKKHEKLVCRHYRHSHNNWGSVTRLFNGFPVVSWYYKPLKAVSWPSIVMRMAVPHAVCIYLYAVWLYLYCI